MKRETSTVGNRITATNGAESEERSQTEERYSVVHLLFWSVSGPDSTYCKEERLGISSYKGDSAVACSTPEMPGGRVW